MYTCLLKKAEPAKSTIVFHDQTWCSPIFIIILEVYVIFADENPAEQLRGTREHCFMLKQAWADDLAFSQ